MTNVEKSLEFVYYTRKICLFGQAIKQQTFKELWGQKS